VTAASSRAAQIRAQLDHPIIDADAHLNEFYPGFLDCVERVGGRDFAANYRARFLGSGTGGGHRGGDFAGWADQSREERLRRRTRRPSWWGVPTKNLADAATAVLPGLLYERMPELGWDFTIVYGGLGLFLPLEADAEVRQISVRALNTLQAEMYAEYADRLCPVAVIPMHTPEEAISELDYAVGELRHKVAMIPAGVPRPIPALHETAPHAFPDAHWMDCFGVDSAHDYDPVWRRFCELGVAVTAHSGTLPVIPWAGRSLTSYSFNHIGNHALHQAALAKSLVMGGITRRFPKLRFALLEGGVAWAFQQLAAMLSLWEKRGVAGLENTNPANLDRAGLLALARKYGGKAIAGRVDELDLSFANYFTGAVAAEDLDEWAALEIERREDFADRFAARLFFGCEADDRANALAADTRLTPLGVRLQTLFGSDIGHFDVPEMARVVEELWELREEGLLDARAFRDLAFANAVRLHGGMNPRFFEGTAVESAAQAVLSE
jgi:hypothetical protein